MNFVILMGNTTADIELRQTSSGKSVANFTLAVPRPFAKDTTDFFSCTAWERIAESLSKHVKKGQKIAIRGNLQNREYTDKNNNKRTVTEVVAQEFFFCGTKSSEASNTPMPQIPSQSEFKPYMPAAYTAPQGFEAVETDPDWPF